MDRAHGKEDKSPSETSIDGLREEAKSPEPRFVPKVSISPETIRPQVASTVERAAALGFDFPSIAQPRIQRGPVTFVRKGVSYSPGEELERRDREERNDFDLSVRNFIELFPFAATLLRGISHDMSPSEQLVALVRNFRRVDFTYSMRFEKKEETILKTGIGSGDCHTLALTMAKVAQDALNLPSISIKKLGNFVAGPNLTIDLAALSHG